MPTSARLIKSAPTVLLVLLTLTLPLCGQDSPGSGFFTTSDKVKLHYREAGQGETILLVPGWLMPADIWESQIQELSKDYHVLALDPRSQGQSDITPVGNDPLRRSNDIQELLEFLHLDSVVLVGWSLGAYDALAYLRQFGNGKLKALVLVDSPLAAASGPGPIPRGTFLKLFESDRENANRNYVWGLFKKPPPKGFYKPLIQSAARIPTDIALATLDNTMPGENWAPSPKALRQVPLLYAITPKYATQAAYLQQVNPQARVETFEASGHALFVDESDRFNALIKDFVRKSSLYPAGLPSAKPHRVVGAQASPAIKASGLGRRQGYAPQVAESSAPASPDKSTPALSPVPTTLPVDTPTALPTTPFTPTPRRTPTVAEVTPISSPPLNVIVSPSPVNSLTPKGKVSPANSMTPSTSLNVSVTPSESPSTLPVRTPKVLPFAKASGDSLTGPTPTPSLSFTGKLSQTWDSFFHRSANRGPDLTTSAGAKPSPTFAGVAPHPYPRRVAPGESIENPVQDGFFTTSDKVKLHYLEAGQGLAILLIPGWLLPAEIWKEQLEGLSEDYHVIALDPRSQGQSDITPQGDEPVRQARDIQELMDHLHLTSVVLVGWSHGGFQVLAYMGQFGTDRLYATVLVDSALGAASNASSTAPRIRFLDQFKNDRVNATRGFVWGLFKKHPPADFTHMLVDAASRTPTDIALALMNNAFPGESYQPSLPTIRQIPLLYAVTPKYTFQANYLTQVDNQARVEFFNDSGHALFYDEAEHFNAVMRDFLVKSALYPAGLPHAAPRPTAAGQMPTHSYLENPK